MVSVTTSKERLVLIAGLAVLVLLSWMYLIDQAADMAAMPMGDMSMQMSWSILELTSLFVMWAVMMVAMMLPSALPMILTFMAVNQKRQSAQRLTVPTYVFTAGYIVVWTLYSVAATALQWYFHEHALISPQMAARGPYLISGILIVAGIYQFTPLKQVCLQNCRSPLSFLMSEWREGYSGAFLMGLRHGGYCVGCCWSLMLLLFVAGVMNLLAVLAIAGFVLAEKLVPRGKWLSQMSGALLIVVGIGAMVANG